MAGLLCLIPGILIGLAIAAVILRAAVSLFNKFSGASSAVREDDDDDYEDDLDRDRDRDDEDDEPRRRPRPKRRSVQSRGGVPEPSFGHAMLIAFISFIVQAVFGFIIGMMMGVAGGGGNMFRGGGAGGQEIMLNLISTVIGFLTLAGICSAMLPTTFPRALGVAALYYVIVIIIVVFIVVLMVVLLR